MAGGQYNDGLQHRGKAEGTGRTRSERHAGQIPDTRQGRPASIATQHRGARTPGWRAPAAAALRTRSSPETGMRPPLQCRPRPPLAGHPAPASAARPPLQRGRPCWQAPAPGLRPAALLSCLPQCGLRGWACCRPDAPRRWAGRRLLRQPAAVAADAQARPRSGWAPGLPAPPARAAAAAGTPQQQAPQRRRAAAWWALRPGRCCQLAPPPGWHPAGGAAL